MRHNTEMLDGLLPLFPLEVALFPRTPLPLHIFEERYKEMIGACVDTDQEFGVVLVRGSGVVRVGCTSKVQEVLKRHEDGSFDVLTMGGRRFHLKEIVSRRSFLEGAVEYFGDEDFNATPSTLIQAAMTWHRKLLQLTGSAEGQPDEDDPELSFQLAQISTDLEFRQSLLEMRSEADRMELVAPHLEKLVRQRSVSDAMKRVAHSNGHGKHLPGLNLPE